MFVDFPGDQGHVIGTGIMIGIMKAVRCHKICIFAAEFSSALIHESHESGFCPGYAFTQCNGNLVGRGDHQTVQCFGYGDGFTDIHTDIGTAPFNAEDSIFRECDRVIRIQIFIGKKGCHDLGDAGGIQLLVHVFPIENSTALCIHDDSACGAYGRSVRPVRIKIGLYSLRFISGQLCR